jgi:hypothetical protein
MTNQFYRGKKNFSWKEQAPLTGMLQFSSWKEEYPNADLK